MDLKSDNLYRMIHFSGNDVHFSFAVQNAKMSCRCLLACVTQQPCFGLQEELRCSSGVTGRGSFLHLVTIWAHMTKD